MSTICTQTTTHLTFDYAFDHVAQEHPFFSITINPCSRCLCSIQSRQLPATLTQPHACSDSTAVTTPMRL